MTLKSSFSEEFIFLKYFRQDWVYLWPSARDQAFSPGIATGHFQQKGDVDLGELPVQTNTSINKLAAVIFVAPFAILVPWGIILSESWDVPPLLSKITKNPPLIHICQIIWVFLGGSNNDYCISRRLLKKASGQYHCTKFSSVLSSLSICICTGMQQLRANSWCVISSIRHPQTYINKTIAFK